MGFAIATKFTAIDHISGTVNKMKSRFKSSFRAMDTSVNRFNRSLSRMNSTTTGMLGNAGIVGGLASISLALKSTANAGINFEQTMVNASAKFGGAADKGSENFKKLEQAALAASQKTKFTAMEAAEGLNFLAMAGFSAEQSVSALPFVTDLAIASNTDFATATDIATDSLGAFGLGSKDAEKNAQGLNRVVDVMAKTVTTANTDMENLFTSVRFAAPSFTAAGQSVETFSALVGVLANSGIKGSKAGTALRASIVRLQKPAKESRTWLKKLGVSVSDSNGNMRDMFDILGDVEKGMEGMGNAQKGAALASIFGAEAVSALQVIMKEGSSGLRKYREQLEGAAGAAGSMARKMEDTTKGSINKFLSAVQALQISLFNLKNTAFRGFIDSMTTIVNKITAAVGANQKLAKALSDDVFIVVVEGIKLFGAFVVALTALKTIAMGATVAMGVFKTAVFGYNIVMKAATAITTLFNLVWRASPLGLVIGLISALAAGGTLVIANWEKVSDFFSSFFNSIADGFKRIWGMIKALVSPFFKIASAISRITGNVNSINSLETSEKAAQNVINQLEAKVISPQSRVANSILEKNSTVTNKTEVTVKGGQGTVLQRTGAKVPGVTVLNSGAF